MKKYLITKISTMFETIKILKSRIGSYIESTKVFVYISAKISWIINKKDNFYLFINNPQHYPKLIIILILVLLALYYNEDNIGAIKTLLNELYWGLVLPIMYLIFKEKIDLNTKKDCLLTIIFILCIIMVPFLGKYEYPLHVLIVLMLIFYAKIINNSFIGEFFDIFFKKYHYFFKGLGFFYLIFYHPFYSQIFFGMMPGKFVVQISSNPSSSKAIIAAVFCLAAVEIHKEHNKTIRHINGGIAQDAANVKATYAATKAAGAAGGIPPIFP